MAKNKDSDTNSNQIDNVKLTIDGNLIKLYKNIFFSYIENEDEHSLYELSKLVRMCMDLNLSPEILLDVHFSTIKEFIEYGEKKAPVLLKRLATYSQIHHELVKGLRDKVKEAEEEFQKSEAKYRTLVENATDYIYMIDRNKKLLSANKSAAIILGKEPEELLGKSIEDILPREISTIYIKSLNQIFKTGRSHDEETKLVAGDKELWIHTSLNLVRDQNGEVIAAMGVSRDITERKKAEEALRESEKRFRAIFDYTTDGIVIVDWESETIYSCNESMCQMLGYSLKELENMKIADVHPKEAFPYVMEQIVKQSRGEFSLVSDIPFKRKDGSVFYTEISSSLISFAGKTYLAGICRDITDRKRAEKALQESEKRYRLLADNASDVIWTVDMNMHLTYASPSITQLLGYSVEESMVNTMEEVFTPASYERAMKIVAEELEIENSKQKDISRSRMLEFDLRRKDGPIVTVEGHFRFLRDPNGQPAEILAMVRDITDRKRAEYALKKSEEKFSKAFRSSPNIFFISRIKDGIILDINDSFTHITGYSREEVVGHTAIEFDFWANTEDRERVVQILQEQGTVSNEEIEFRMKSGEIRTLLLSAEMSNIGGEPCIIFIAVDITDRKRAAEEHKESEEKCYSLVNSIDSHVYLVDRDCRYLLVNNRYLSRLGLPRDQVIGSAYGEFHPKASTERFVVTVEEVFKTGKFIHLEYKSHRDGRQFLRTFSPVKDPKTGKIIAVTVMSKDITENYQEDNFDNY